jgi:ribosome-binding protein aMBF1 (putative translation factor)
MSQVTDILNAARQLRAKRGWSKSRLALEANLHANTLLKIDDENASFNMRTIEKLEALLSSQEAPPQ